MRAYAIFPYVALYSLIIWGGCQSPKPAPSTADNSSAPAKATADTSAWQRPEWVKGTAYEIFTRSFADSNGDGIGDLQGMIAKLDYLKDLGIEAIWLTPINQSPSYHKYDVVDYYNIDKEYGTIDDFKAFTAAAHERGMKVLMDLVINHTGVTNPWFLAAREGKDNPYRDWYVWSDNPETWKSEAEYYAKIPNLPEDPLKKAESHWHWLYDDKGKLLPDQKEKYYAFFWGGMPDANFDNPIVRKEFFKIGQYWLQEVGIDGYRLDAAKHIYLESEMEKSRQFWKEFKAKMLEIKPDAFMLGEVWDKTELIAPFFDGLDAIFNFDLGLAMTQIAAAEQDTIDIGRYHQNMRDIYKMYNPNFIEATFLTNHDQNRVMSEVKGNINRAKMAAAMLFTLPGTPFLYYGEEIGMKGVKPDEHIREPFIWASGKEDKQQTNWVKSKYNTSLTPLAQQKADSASMFSYYKKWIALRRQHPALNSGDLAAAPELRKGSITAYYRTHPQENLLVLHNLGAKPATVVLADKVKTESIVYSNNNVAIDNNNLKLPPYTTVLISQ